MTVQQWPLAKIRPSAKNPNTHPAGQLEKIKASISQLGFNNPILARPDGEIIAGEARWLAAQALGIELVPVIVLDHLNEAQADLYRVADNRLARDAVWDEKRLAAVLQEIDAHDLDLRLTGFSDREVLKLLAKVEPAGESDIDRAPAMPDKPVSQLGDLWLLGDHRVLCGDSTLGESYDLLMAGGRQSDAVLIDAIENADLVFTDPPYGMSYASKKHGMILNDDAQGSALVDLVSGALRAARQVSRKDAATYVCLTWRTYCEFMAAMKRASLDVAACIVWDKGSIGLGSQHYRPQHEFVFYSKGGRWFGGKDQGDVWRLGRDASSAYKHPTQKPVALIEIALANSTDRGDIVLDPFGGSGSTLIACEQQGRFARLIELDPKYVDVIVRRWQDMTGKAALLLPSGETFSGIAASRAA